MKIVILSGFFNPLHGGHLDMIEEGAVMGDKLVVIVNNDVQQKLKKGKIIGKKKGKILLFTYKGKTSYTKELSNEFITPSSVTTSTHGNKGFKIFVMVGKQLVDNCLIGVFAFPIPHVFLNT